MKAKHRKAKASGGSMDSPKSGDKDWEKDKLPSTVYAGKGSNVEKEADERKRGGRAKRKAGGKVGGAAPAVNVGRAPRKNGGRTGSNFSPFSSARHGQAPRGHSTTDVD